MNVVLCILLGGVGNLIFLHSSGQRNGTMPQLSAKMISYGVDTALIETTLTNGGRDSIAYLSWSCSKETLCFLKSNQLQLQMNQNCTKNVPEVIRLAPGEQRTELLHFRIVTKAKGPGSLRMPLCFSYIQYEGGASLMDMFTRSASERRSAYPILQSNELDFTDLLK